MISLLLRSASLGGTQQETDRKKTKLKAGMWRNGYVTTENGENEGTRELSRAKLKCQNFSKDEILEIGGF